MTRMTPTEYARHRAVSLQAVQYQMERGNLVRGRDGKLESEEADAAWVPVSGPAPNLATAHRRNRVGVATQLVKYNLDKVQLETIESRHRERDFTAGQLTQAGEITLRVLQQEELADATSLAELVDCAPSKAGAILHEAIATMMAADLPDIRGELTDLLGAM